jgi:hypothetical protein
MTIGRASVEFFWYSPEIDTASNPENDISLLFHYGPKPVVTDDELPDVHGMSGCGIWRLSTPKPFDRWTLDDVKLVATEHEWERKKHFLRATPIVYTIQAIYRQFPELRSVIDINVGLPTSKWL